MPPPKAKKLSSLFRSAKSAATAKPPPATTTTNSGAAESALKLPSSAGDSSLRKIGNDGPICHMIHQRLQQTSDDSTQQITYEISSLLPRGIIEEFDDDSSKSVAADDGCDSEDESSSWFPNFFNISMPHQRKVISRVRKNKWIFKNSQKTCFSKLVSMCLEKVGSFSTFHVLSKLGRETGLKEYNAIIEGCIETARGSKDEIFQTQQILEIYRVFQAMKECGFPIQEESFGSFLLYLIDMHLTDQFFVFIEIIKDEALGLHPRLGYYEMLLCIETGNDEKIQELCDKIAFDESEIGPLLLENYLLALCERDRMKEVRQLLEILDITKVSSMDNLACIFRCLGRLTLESLAKVYTQALKDCDHGAQSISDLIYYYTTCTKKLVVEDVIVKFKEMHGELDVELLPGSYEKLITFCCDSREVYLALDIVDEMCKAGLPVSTETLNSICRACEDTSEFILVRRIHSMLRQHNLKANSETFRIMINLNVRMKEFGSAFTMLKESKTFNLMPTASMYNAILAGFYREKNMQGVRWVLQEMKDADVKPDSHTYAFLINNSACEEEIVKYFEELKCASVQVTKQIFMALVNAYAACGQFEKAKQVVHDKGVPVKNLTELRSVLVSTLASYGKHSEALDIYREIKQSGFRVEPKAIISLIEHLQSGGGELSVSLELLEELDDPSYWVDGCCRTIAYCLRNKDLRSAVDLLKKLADYFEDEELAKEVMFDEVFAQIAHMEPVDLQLGIGLLEAIKKELNLRPSRKCLDFLLSVCVSAKDLPNSQMVWKEYQTAGLPYNIISYLRMYQAYLASGHLNAASKFLSKIPKDDPHVRSVIHACGVTYGKPKDKKKKTKKKQILGEEEGCK